MRTTEGFVCVAEVKSDIELQMFFGWPIDKALIAQGYESFQSNGMTPFASFPAAVLARDAMQKRRDFRLVSIAKIEMTVAETPEDWKNPKFQGAGRWVVVFKADFNTNLLIGELIHENQARAVPGEELITNGVVPFKSLTAAKHAVAEWSRQGASRAYISTFSSEPSD